MSERKAYVGGGRLRVSNGFVAAVAALVMMLVAPAGASALTPWEYPDGNGFNQRRSNDAPPRAIGCCSGNPAGPKLPTWQRAFDSEVTGTPIAARNGGVYVGDRSGVLHVLIYSNGRTLCSQNVGRTGTGTPPSPITGSPLYVDSKQTVYVVTNAPGSPRLAAVDPVNCDIKWVSDQLDQNQNGLWEATDPTYSPATDLIYLGTCVCSAEDAGASGVGGAGHVVAIDPDTGQTVWATRTVLPGFNGGAVGGTPVLNESLGRIYVGTGNAFVGSVADPNTDSILALDALTGVIVGGYQTRQNDIGRPDDPDPTQRLGFDTALINITSGGQLLVAGIDRGGIFYAVDPATMELVYKTQVGTGATSVGAPSGLTFDPSKRVVHGVTSTPALYFGINADDGSMLYMQPGTDALHYGEPSFASQAVWSTDTEGFVDIQDPTNGRILGRLPLKAPSIGGVSFSRKMAFVAIGTGRGTPGGVAMFK